MMSVAVERERIRAREHWKKTLGQLPEAARPVVGPQLWSNSFLPGIYLEGVTLAGGIATLLPPQPVDAEIAGQVLDGIDGLIITGGRDVDPASYGHDPHPTNTLGCVFGRTPLRVALDHARKREPSAPRAR